MRLENDQPLPDLVALDATSATTSLQEHIAGRWAVVLFYRGHW